MSKTVLIGQKLRLIWQRRRAVSVTSYALAVGLIGVLALFSVQRVGSGVTSLFSSVGNRLGNVQAGSFGQSAPSGPPNLAWGGSGSGLNVTGPATTGTPVNFTLSNNGSGTSSSVSGTIAVTGANPTAFPITSNGCTGTLAPGASCTVQITPTANANGSFSATLATTADNAPQLALSGTASGFSYASCKAAYDAGQTTSGTYSIDPDGAGSIVAYNAYCNMTLAGGGWTLCAWYNGTSSGTLGSLAGSDWGADPINQSATGMKGCEALRSASATQEVLVATSSGYSLRFQGVASSWASYSTYQFVSWPGTTSGYTPVFSAGNSTEHIFGINDPDYAFGATCGNYSPAVYLLAINQRYYPNSGSCVGPNAMSSAVEFGIHDKENCNLCNCNWSSCWSGKTNPNVGIYVR